MGFYITKSYFGYVSIAFRPAEFPLAVFARIREN